MTEKVKAKKVVKKPLKAAEAKKTKKSVTKAKLPTAAAVKKQPVKKVKQVLKVEDKPAAVEAPVAIVKTNSEQIWESIKDVEIEMFALPNQRINNYCAYSPIDPDKCFLTYKISSVLPALESALHKHYNLELVRQFIVLTKR